MITIEDIIRAIQQETDSSPIIARRNLLKRVAGSIVETFDNLPEGQELKAKFKLLTNNSFERIIKAPETFFALLSHIKIEINEDTHNKSLSNFLKGVTSIENSLTGVSSKFDTPTWSALGDIYVPKGEWNVSEMNSSLNFNQGKVYFSPCVHGIVLDGYSPRIIREIEIEKKESWPFSTLCISNLDQIAIVSIKIKEALEILKIHAPMFYKLITTHIIVINIVSDDSGYFTSASCNAEIGRMTIHNAHRPIVDTTHIINALVHESIHSFIYCREQDIPLMLIAPEKDTKSLVSPWSGGLLKLHGYLHACFVWWGLVELWENIIDNIPAHFKSNAQILLNRASKGFHTEKIITNLIPYREQINLDLFNWLNKIPIGWQANKNRSKWA